MYVINWLEVIIMSAYSMIAQFIYFIKICCIDVALRLGTSLVEGGERYRGTIWELFVCEIFSNSHPFVFLIKHMYC